MCYECSPEKIKRTSQFPIWMGILLSLLSFLLLTGCDTPASINSTARDNGANNDQSNQQPSCQGIVINNSCNQGQQPNGTGGNSSSGGFIELGGVNMVGYCQSIGYQGVSLDGNTAYDWHCVTASGSRVSISMADACQWQYGRSDVLERMNDYNDPYSWKCYVPN